MLHISQTTARRIALGKVVQLAPVFLGVAGFVMLAIGLIVYLAAFAKGPGPTMGDDTLQASLFTLATILLIGGFIFIAVI